jgi:hypothetical protein
MLDVYGYVYIYICIHKQNCIHVHIETQRPRSKSPHQIDCGTCTQESLMTYVGPPFTIAKLVQITPITSNNYMVYDSYNYSIHGV